MNPSTDEKSNLPSLGSISSQDTTASTVLSFFSTSRGQLVFMYSRLEELELRNSPPRIRNGLPSTTSWRTPCRVSKCGREGPPGPAWTCTAIKASSASAGKRGFIEGTSQLLSSCSLHSRLCFVDCARVIFLGPCAQRKIRCENSHRLFLQCVASWPLPSTCQTCGTCFSLR